METRFRFLKDAIKPTHLISGLAKNKSETLFFFLTNNSIKCVDFTEEKSEVRTNAIGDIAECYQRLVID